MWTSSIVLRGVCSFLLPIELFKVRRLCKATEKQVPDPFTIPVRVVVQLGELTASPCTYLNYTAYCYVGWFPEPTKGERAMLEYDEQPCSVMAHPDKAELRLGACSVHADPMPKRKTKSAPATTSTSSRARSKRLCGLPPKATETHTPLTALGTRQWRSVLAVLIGCCISQDLITTLSTSFPARARQHVIGSAREVTRSPTYRDSCYLVRMCSTRPAALSRRAVYVRHVTVCALNPIR